MFLLDVSDEWLPGAVADVGALNGGRVGSFRGDVRATDDVEAAVERCERDLGPVDVCINNVAFARSSHTLEISDEEWEQTVDTSLTGNFRVSRAIGRRMVERGRGVIVSTSSTAAVASEPGHAHYGAVKAGVLALTRVLARELAPHGVRVCALCPGQIDTYPWYNLEFRRLYTAGIAAGRFGDPAEVANVFLYLASEDARNVTGAVFVVDGGMLAWE